MVLRRFCLMAVVMCLSGQALAQQAAPVQPAAPPPPAATPVQPQAATPAPPPADAPLAKADAAQPAAAPAKSPSSSLADGELDADKIMAAQKAGYQIKNENGQTLLCRKDLQTGSRLRYRTSCLTAREWEQLQEDNALVLKSMERRPHASN